MILREKVTLCKEMEWEETGEMAFKSERIVCANTKVEK